MKEKERKWNNNKMWTNHVSSATTTTTKINAAAWSLLTILLLFATDKSINAFNLSPDNSGSSGGDSTTTANVNVNDNINNRPPYHEYAKIARYLVHKSNWTSMGKYK